MMAARLSGGAVVLPPRLPTPADDPVTVPVRKDVPDDRRDRDAALPRLAPDGCVQSAGNSDMEPRIHSVSAQRAAAAPRR